jgi:Ser/Thr protein kinase RdoA (MazF antagonist)
MSTETDFYSTSPQEQIRRLEGVARTALPAWGLEGAAISEVAYRENMTFRIDSGDRAFAMRVHQANYRTDAQIQSELDFMTYLKEEGIPTPQVVHTLAGESFTSAWSEGVDRPRQVDVFEWIDGRPLRMSGFPVSDVAATAEAYTEVGRLAARIYNAADKWQTPAGFERIAWDAQGMFGVNGNIGDFRRLQGVPEEQMRLLQDIAERLDATLGEFGKTPDQYGLTQGDLLGENIFVCEDGMRILDFDDAGDGWYMFELCTAVFDLADTPAFEPCLSALVRGYREQRDLPDEHVAMLPAFFLGRLLSYLGWCAKKPHMPQTAFMQPLLLAAAERHGRAFLVGESTLI